MINTYVRREKRVFSWTGHDNAIQNGYFIHSVPLELHESGLSSICNRKVRVIEDLGWIM